MIVNDVAILRTISQEVQPSEIDNLIHLLEGELQHSALMGRPGIGLAAIQIGIPKKAAIIRIPTNGLDNMSVNLINAEIKEQHKPFVFQGEGCLSFNGASHNTTRYQEIYVVNNAVKPYSFIATGLLAVAIQHELDHTNGILFHDRMVKPTVLSKSKMKPNDLCICGSGKKYKRCCGR